MVGLVLVSHSRKLAEATLSLVRAMTGDEVPMAIAAGAGDNHEDFGTDAVEIFEAISSLMSDDGVVVMMDMGSAVLSAEMALDFLDETQRNNVRLCPSSFVEGAVAAGVAAKIGSKIDDVLHEAAASLIQKTDHIAPQQVQIVAEDAEQKRDAVTIKVTIPMPNGLHARPVAQLIQEAAKYNSDIKIRNLTNGKGPVSAKSMTGIVALEALYGHEVELAAAGDDAEFALSNIQKAILAGLGDDLSIKPTEAMVKSNQPASKQQRHKPIGISSGIVVGKVYYPEHATVNISDKLIENTDEEIKLFHSALSRAADMLRSKAKGLKSGEIFTAQALVLQDPAIISKVEDGIKEHRQNAAYIWWQVVEEAINEYKNLNDDNLRQRAADLQDVRLQVLELLGVQVNDELVIPSEGIMVVGDLTPGQVTSLDISKVKGVICIENGQTSHSSILLRSRGIPAIVQAQYFSSDIRALPSSTVLAMDGESGEIWINPADNELELIEKKKADWQENIKQAKLNSATPAATTDGFKVDVFANIGSVEDSNTAAENGADGIGLLRTEFMFLDRETAPTEEEQLQVLRALLSPMNGKTAIIRTLDAGGDKDIPYLNMPKEANPYLGVRAIRLCLRNRNLFQQQLRAILRAAAEFDVQIMFPLISTIDELREAKAELQKAHESLAGEGVAHKWPITTGMMMEVPSAAILADKFAAEVDFMSIGTNDLTQYTMAMDRGNPELQNSLCEGLEPAVIALIAKIAQACKKNNILLAVCGEAAADSHIASTLLGLGVRELSMNGRSIPNMKQWIRNQAMADMEKKMSDTII